MENNLKEKIGKHIELLMKQFVNNYKNCEDIHSRLDEMFLLWSDINYQPFNKSVEEFGLDHNDFSNKQYGNISVQIVDRFKEYFENLGDF